MNVCISITTVQNLEKCYVGKPDAAKVACPVWRGLGRNVFRKEQRAALPPYATQLLNAGCRITSIQRFLGHKKLNTTMIYARAHDQNVAEDYFAAMQRVEQRLAIVPDPAGKDTPGEPESPPPDLPAQAEQPSENGTKDEVIKVQERERFLAWVELLSRPVLRKSERLEITAALKKALLGDGTIAPEPPG